MTKMPARVLSQLMTVGQNGENVIGSEKSYEERPASAFRVLAQTITVT